MLKRKTQIAFDLEAVEGTPDATPLSSGKQITIFEPEFSPAKEEISLVAGQSTLSPTASLIGLETGEAKFKMIARSKASAAEPDWSAVAQACGLKRTAGVSFEIDGSASGTFLGGELLTFAPSSAVGLCVGTIEAAVGVDVPYLLVSGTPADTDTVTGATSGATGAIATGGEAKSYGNKFAPVSYLGTRIQTGSWTGTAPVVGEVIKHSTNNVFGVVTAKTSDTDFEIEPIEGDFSNGEGIVGQTGGGTATISAAPTQTTNPSATIETNIDGTLHRLVGARGTADLVFDPGQPTFWEFSFSGMDAAYTGKALDSYTPDTSIPTVFRDARVLVDSMGFVVTGAKLGLGNNVFVRKDPRATTGGTSQRISDRSMEFSIDMEAVNPSVKDFWTKWKNGTIIPLWLGIGKTEGTRMGIYVPKFQITGWTYSDNDGVVIASLTGKATGSADDEIAIFTS
jgi:hypothetical protein